MNRFILGLSVLGALAFSGCSHDNPTAQTTATSAPEGAPVLDLSSDTSSPESLSRKGKFPVSLIHLKSEVRHFGYNLTSNPPASIDYRTVVPNAHVWVAEYPTTKAMNIYTDSLGQFELYVLKFTSDTINLSFVYEKDFYPASVETAVFGTALPSGWDISIGKSNVIQVVDQNIEDLGMQLPDELYFYYAKSNVEGQISKLIGAPYTLSNAVVVTVGKSWASLYSDSLPHGDPGAHTQITPNTTSPLQGPIYFDEHVQPNATYTATSVDGGVLYNSLPVGLHSITASKSPYTYSTVTFNIEEGIHFYVASPPHSIQSSNTSLPREN